MTDVDGTDTGAATSGLAGLDGATIEVRVRGNEVHAACPDYGLYASADSADAALAALGKGLGDLKAFEARSGLTAATRVGAVLPGARVRSDWARRVGVPVLIGGIVALQIGWAVALGLSSGLGRAFNTEWRDGLVVSLERQVLALAEPRHELGREQQERLIAAVRAIRERYGPIWTEIVAQPTKPDRR